MIPVHALTIRIQVPGNISLHEAATIPDSFVTAYHSLATELGVPLPLSFPSPAAPTNPGLCILIWGGASTSGMFAIQASPSPFANNTHPACAETTATVVRFCARRGTQTFSASRPRGTFPCSRPLARARRTTTRLRISRARSPRSTSTSHSTASATRRRPCVRSPPS